MSYRAYIAGDERDGQNFSAPNRSLYNTIAGLHREKQDKP